MGKARLTPERRNELLGILLLAGGVLLLMSLVSYRPEDLTFFTGRSGAQVQNLCGVVGAAVAGVIRSALGLTGYFVAALGAFWAMTLFNGTPPQRPAGKLLSACLFCLAVSSLLSIVWIQTPEARVHRGGLLGLLVGNRLVHYFGWWGTLVVLSAVSLLCFVVVTEMAALNLLSQAGRWVGRPTGRFLETIRRQLKSSAILHRASSLPKARPVAYRSGEPHRTPAMAPVIREPAAEKLRPSEAELPKPSPAKRPSTSFKLPSLDLLDPAHPPQAGPGKEWAEKNAKVLEESLRDFGIEARVAEVEIGPVITRYEVEPAAGVKVQKITTLTDDLALVLKAPSVRIVAPIPGKARVGIEVPNPSSSLVSLREVLESKEFRESASKLTLAIGKDTAGHPLVADLAQMPHLLIAGTTGSGKTVCVNALITSILFNATPEEVRFLMVDPKMVELSVFNGLPHLILPVLTNPKQVPRALEWVVQEMETRYRLFAKLGVRNIESYHERLAQNQLPVEEIPEALPYLVVIIDELADLMLIAQAEVERTIARLAHLSRAVGIHMVLATQRPSVDVLTGVIKANFPARISFQVASRVDSRTVLDNMGAEKLLSKGDLLFMQPGSSKLIRGQGTLMTDEEIERVVSFLKAERPPEYDTSILEAETKGSEPTERERDSLYPEAVRVVVESAQASVSLLQRRMRLGYGRAARILDMMEEEGIVGPIRGAKPREVYLKELPDDVHRTTSEVRA